MVSHTPVRSASITAMNKYAPCPCRSDQQYQKCCRPYHIGMPAPNALSLMRSRYCAYALDLVDYVIATTHPANEQYTNDTAGWKTDLHSFCNNTRFESLQIVDFTDGDPVAYVTFRAGLTQGKNDVSFSERSTFEKLDGRWLYKAGERVD